MAYGLWLMEYGGNGLDAVLVVPPKRKRKKCFYDRADFRRNIADGGGRQRAKQEACRIQMIKRQICCAVVDFLETAVFVLDGFHAVDG